MSSCRSPGSAGGSQRTAPPGSPERARTGDGSPAVRVGVTLPTFRSDAETALAGAQRAERLGLDGVFVFDHLWPLGRPDRPALAAFPVLGAVAAVTGSVAVGSLVARVGLVPDAVMVARFQALAALAPGRVVAGLGTGDLKSAAENLAYGIPFGTAAERRRSLAECARALAADAIAVWIGGGAPGTVAVARSTGAAVNLWDAPPSAVAAQAASTEVTWGGPVPVEPAAIVELLRPVVVAGARWVVCAWPASLPAVAEAATELRRIPAGTP